MREVLKMILPGREVEISILKPKSLVFLGFFVIDHPGLSWSLYPYGAIRYINDRPVQLLVGKPHRYRWESHTTGIHIGSNMIQKSSKNDPRMVQQSSKNDSRMVQKTSKNDPRMVQKSSKNDPRMVQKSSQNHPKIIQQLSKNGSKIIEHWHQDQQGYRGETSTRLSGKVLWETNFTFWIFDKFCRNV